MRPVALALVSALTVGCSAVAPQSPSITGSTPQSQASATSSQAPVVVSCEPHQKAMVREAMTNGARQLEVQCVAASPATVALVEAAPAVTAPVAAAPVVATAPLVASAAPVQYASTPVVYTQAPRAARVRRAVVDDGWETYQPRERAKPRRSWQKTALVIGGASGAGAGIGALIGGKKGALIGAAVGGGGAGIYEATRRR